MATATKPVTTTPRKSGTSTKKAVTKRPTAPSKAAKTANSGTAPIVKKTGAKPVAPKKVSAKPAVKLEKAPKAKKPKLVRDSFTIPKAEFVVLEELKQRAAKLARPVKKSELLRAGIKAIAAMQDAAFLTALNNVPAIKTGRPTLAG
ncbi:MAG TPA: hypothetical protein VE934_17930 [Polaromonas sp.]|uniref:hypothetical protein n=1 Tax=Polaromonas sp. TaxID=1869339 RepID=UPI002D626BC6|nr:hypothetical protein [Polaromonas sp.]HYW58835.1 hypothetical protein [Polaromonas sp.]